jgi:hypothetical protein
VRGTDQQRHGHRGGHALSADVADHDEGCAICCWKNLKEVAANLTCRLVDALNSESGNWRNLLWNKNLLHAPGRLHLVLEVFFIATRTRKAQAKHAQHP